MPLNIRAIPAAQAPRAASATTLGVFAIIPDPGKFLTPQQAQFRIDAWLRDCAFEFQREMQQYPLWQQWKNRPPRRGPRKDGRRTGALGRGWTHAPRFTKNSVTIRNQVRYAAWVQGSKTKYPGQARALASRGWDSVDDIAIIVARRANRKIVFGRR